MLKDFENVKRELAELSDVLNKFKSEAVQLQIVDLLFEHFSVSPVHDRGMATEKHKKSQGSRPPKKKVAKKQVDSGTPSEKKKTTTGSGAIATLVKVYDDGFFGQPRTIKDILAHCETNMARRIKSNEISGKLARMVRNGDLTRKKNAEGQYEYQKP